MKWKTFGKKASDPAAGSEPQASGPLSYESAGAVPYTAGISGEIAAVIAAAVSAMMPEGARYAIKGISRPRTRGERPVWASAGLLENTRPF